MLRIVLPVAIRSAISAVDVGTAASAHVGVSIEIVIVVYVDVVVAAPSAVIAPAPRPHCSHGHSNAEGNCHSRSVVTWGRIRNGGIGIRRRTIHYSGVIARNVNDLRIGLLDHNHLLVLHHLRLYLHLLVRLQVSLILCLRAHALDGIHYIRLLRQESIS